MIFVPYANPQGVDTVIRLTSRDSGFKTGYDRILYIGTHFPSTLVAFVRRQADGTEQVLASPALKLACALKAGENLPGSRAIVDDEVKIAEKGVCVAEDLVETIAPYARAHAEELGARVLSRNPAAMRAAYKKKSRQSFRF